MLSRLYGLIVGARNRLYDLGLLAVHEVAPVVVSVGNIEAGGTGKTPFVMALAEELRKRGVRTCIVTRGYRGRLKGPILVTASSDSADVGDEALLMARRLDGVPVVKSPNRVRGALFARAAFGAEAVILDDGFQHRRIARDMDIVLVGRDITREPLLPAGILREPVEALARAHHVVAMKGSSLSPLRADLAPSALVGPDGRTFPLEALEGKDVVAFCAIGSPGHFFELARGLCRSVEGVEFPDHHRYTRRDAGMIMKRLGESRVLLTTEKDLVKIDPAWFDEAPGRLFALRIPLLRQGFEDITDEIEQLVEARRVPGQGRHPDQGHGLPERP